MKAALPEQVNFTWDRECHSGPVGIAELQWAWWFQSSHHLHLEDNQQRERNHDDLQ